MTRSLPSTPNLRYLKEEAKDILKARKNGDVSCCGTLRHLRQFKRKTDEEVLQAKIGLQEVQFALALEYEFRSWDELKRFVEHAQCSKGETVETRNIETFKAYIDACNRGEPADQWVTPSCLMHYDDETILYDEARRSWEPAPVTKSKCVGGGRTAHVIEDIVASGDKVIARMFVESFLHDGSKQRMHYTSTQRLVEGRLAESWIPQQRPRAQVNDAPPSTRPAMSWLDEHIALSKANEEIVYIDCLLRQMVKSAPTSVTMNEDERLPEVKNPETGAAIGTIFEHVLEWCRGKVAQGQRLHFRHEDKYYIVQVSVEEEPNFRCRIDMEKWAKNNALREFTRICG